MDKVTQQNAANAEESASASQELTTQAEQMKAIVKKLTKLVKGTQGHYVTNASSSQQGLPSNSGHDVFHEIAAGVTPKSSVSRVKTSAEKTIPLDDDFSDFDM